VSIYLPSAPLPVSAQVTAEGLLPFTLDKQIVFQEAVSRIVNGTAFTVFAVNASVITTSSGAPPGR
jgi:hypothetical protein